MFPAVCFYIFAVFRNIAHDFVRVSSDPGPEFPSLHSRLKAAGGFRRIFDKSGTVKLFVIQKGVDGAGRAAVIIKAREILNRCPFHFFTAGEVVSREFHVSQGFAALDPEIGKSQPVGVLIV